MTDTLSPRPAGAIASADAPQPWWKKAVAYQVYPRSFQDSDGDGVGDLRGIIDHVDHLAWLGIDVLWLSPVYPSPHDDNGYDISDYRGIDPVFGSMDDFDDLVAALHARGIRLVMDLVVNHTSDEHPWFIESRSSRDSPKRDWYWWRDPKPDGSAPNNWASHFSGSAWEYDDTTAQSYLHIFSRKQPDLNWENPEVRDAVFEMMNWWLDRGVDGFRMDVINFISKVPGLPDGELIGDGPLGNGRPLYSDGPRLVEFLREMRERVFDNRDDVLFTVGETPRLPVERAKELTDAETGAVNMVFQFEHVNIDHGADKWHPLPFDIRRLKASLARWQEGLGDGGWNSLYWNNHDQPRVVSRWGDPGAFRVESAKAFATVLHLHRGTPYVYQGEEIGMTNIEVDSLDDLTDIQSRNHYLVTLAERPSLDPKDLLTSIRPLARDNARSPMHWDATAHAGFTAGTPWMKVNPNHSTINVAAARADPDSVLHHYRSLVALRHGSDLIAYGDCVVGALDHDQLYLVTRTLGDQTAVMIANLSGRDAHAGQAVGAHSGLALALSNYADSPAAIEDLEVLRPWEALVYMEA